MEQRIPYIKSNTSTTPIRFMLTSIVYWYLTGDRNISVVKTSAICSGHFVKLQHTLALFVWLNKKASVSIKLV